MKDVKNQVFSKGTLRSEIRTYIQNQIATGHYQAGDRIVETQLARELNVSQAPVRVAMLELATMGILEERPYSGSFVRSLTADDVEDIYETRAILDEYAASRAARFITEEELARLETLLDEMEAAEDTRVFVEKDIAFHEQIADAARSPSIKRIWEVLRLVEWTWLSAAITGSTLPELTAQHRRIYEHISKHDERSAGAYMFLHIKGFGEELKRHIERRLAADAAAETEK